MARLKIDEVCPKGEGNPIVINFLNAYPTTAFKRIPCNILEDRITKEKIYACEIDDMLYTGKIVKEKHMQTVIVRRDKNTGRVAVIATEFVQMKPEILPELHETVNATDPNEEIGVCEHTRAFGSKKLRHQMIEREKMGKNVEINTAQMLTTARNAQESRADFVSYTDNTENFYIPPIDSTAIHIQDVYDVTKILTDDEFEKILSELSGKVVISDMIPWIQELMAAKMLSSRHTVLTVYANYLLKLYNTLAKKIIKKSFLACPHSKTLNEIIIKNFTFQINGKLLRSAAYKDKSLCYAAVIILLVNDFKFDLNGLCETVKLSHRTVSIKIRITGACITNIDGKKIVQLKLPLNSKRGFKVKNPSF